jgi:hypothetical protein
VFQLELGNMDERCSFAALNSEHKTQYASSSSLGYSILPGAEDSVLSLIALLLQQGDSARIYVEDTRAYVILQPISKLAIDLILIAPRRLRPTRSDHQQQLPVNCIRRPFTPSKPPHHLLTVKMLRTQITKLARVTPSTFQRSFSMAAVRSAEGDTGATRSGGSASAYILSLGRGSKDRELMIY